MTEKEYRKLIAENEITTDLKELLNQTSDEVINSLYEDLTPLVRITSLKRVDDLSQAIAIADEDAVKIVCLVNTDTSLEPTLEKQLIINTITNQLLINLNSNLIKSLDILNQEQIIFKLTNQLKVIIKVITDEEYNNIERASKWLDELQNKYTYFKNVIKILKVYLQEQNIEIITTNQLILLLAYSLEHYHNGNKYEDYILAFEKALDDFISGKKIEIDNTYQNLTPLLAPDLKGYVIANPYYTNKNLTSNINDSNISEYRKFKKRLNKLHEKLESDQGTATLTLNITPITNANNYLWHYEVLGRSLSGQGGEYQLNEIEYKTATLKGLFKGLKAITTNINNKNITIITPLSNLLQCEEKSVIEQENNSRRKTITKFIDENKLIIKWRVEK